MSCIGCGRGFHWECSEQPCCCSHERTTLETQTLLPQPTGGSDTRNYKPDNEIGISAGRKRAAVKFEINKGEPCEWRMQANCGGGKYPIVGCVNGKQQNRHHGPDKKTSNNDDNNVHLICASCHNLWHAKNDPYYIRDEYALLPHSPKPASAEDILLRNA